MREEKRKKPSVDLVCGVLVVVLLLILKEWRNTRKRETVSFNVVVVVWFGVKLEVAECA